jgi:hypothetical protein
MASHAARALLAFFILVGTIPAYRQSCALCYTQAAQSGSAHDRNLEESNLDFDRPSDADNDRRDWRPLSQAQSVQAVGGSGGIRRQLVM